MSERKFRSGVNNVEDSSYYIPLKSSAIPVSVKKTTVEKEITPTHLRPRIDSRFMNETTTDQDETNIDDNERRNDIFQNNIDNQKVRKKKFRPKPKYPGLNQSPRNESRKYETENENFSRNSTNILDYYERGGQSVPVSITNISRHVDFQSTNLDTTCESEQPKYQVELSNSTTYPVSKKRKKEYFHRLKKLNGNNIVKLINIIEKRNYSKNIDKHHSKEYLLNNQTKSNNNNLSITNDKYTMSNSNKNLKLDKNIQIGDIGSNNRLESVSSTTQSDYLDTSAGKNYEKIKDLNISSENIKTHLIAYDCDLSAKSCNNCYTSSSNTKCHLFNICPDDCMKKKIRRFKLSKNNSSQLTNDEMATKKIMLKNVYNSSNFKHDLKKDNPNFYKTKLNVQIMQLIIVLLFMIALITLLYKIDYKYIYEVLHKVFISLPSSIRPKKTLSNKEKFLQMVNSLWSRFSYIFRIIFNLGQ